VRFNDTIKYNNLCEKQKLVILPRDAHLFILSYWAFTYMDIWRRPKFSLIMMLTFLSRNDISDHVFGQLLQTLVFCHCIFH